MLRRTAARLLTPSFGQLAVPNLPNLPMNDFEPGSASRAKLQAACKRLRDAPPLDIPIVINGKEYRSADKQVKTIPSDTSKTLATFYNATPEMAHEAIVSSLHAWKAWSRAPWHDRAAVVLKAAHLISTSHRFDFQAATMLGQSKNPWQAEIDAIAETVDFYRFNVQFAQQMYAEQPQSPVNGSIWNMTEYRPLEGFVTAVSPFNFTAIGANLATTPALVGNTVLWKPAPAAILSSYLTYKILEEAGLPAGVINFVPCSPQVLRDVVLKHPDLAGLVFTGSTEVFTSIWQHVGQNLPNYRSYPRISGETGGKDFHLVHPSAHLQTAVAASVRSAFEYQGQKCSALSRLFVPKTMWPEFKEKMLAAHAQLKMGQPDEFDSFMCAVIDENSYNKNVRYINIAREDPACKIIAGGGYSSARGWFVEPTIIETTNPESRTLREEIFGPVLTVFVWDDTKQGGWEQLLHIVESGTKYGLTGSIFARDRDAIRAAADTLRYAAGNLYINDKCTGAVVGQQPFGGARASGTNDKAGAPAFLHRWVSPRTIKETFEQMPGISYPHQLPDVVRVE